jgi:hypothetical protein
MRPISSLFAGVALLVIENTSASAGKASSIMSGNDWVYHSTRACFKGACEVKKSYTSCSAHVTKCRSDKRSDPDSPRLCQAAGASCMRTGIFEGPYSHQVSSGLSKN